MVCTAVLLLPEASVAVQVRVITLLPAVPSLLMGCAFPLANAIVQHAEATVGRRAGLLYLANTAGAVCGSLVVGFLFLPMLGIQGTATALMIATAAAIISVPPAIAVAAFCAEGPLGVQYADLLRWLPFCLATLWTAIVSPRWLLDSLQPRAFSHPRYAVREA